MNKGSRIAKAIAPWLIAGSAYYAWDKYDKEKQAAEIKLEQLSENAGFSEKERRRWNKMINREVDDKPEYRQR